MKLKEQTIMCQVSTCKRAGKYLMKVDGQWCFVCASHERHFGLVNLRRLGLPEEEIKAIMAMEEEQ